uniref:Uncharacterized protein isoform X1 n=1 Tax=Pogona vitticeps TaxID=103695 RepID=A0ABM5ERD8_9SAUR
MCRRRPARTLRSFLKLLRPRALAPKVLDVLLFFWQTMWVALFCYKLCWEALFHLAQQACCSMTLWLEDFRETPPGGAPLSAPASPGPKEAGAEEQEVPNRPASGHGGLLSRLSRLEAEVQYLSQELRAEKLLWSSRYLELLREQQGLLAQLQGQDQTLWLQDLEGQTDAWGPPDGPRGPSDPGSTARGVGTQTGEEGAAGPRRRRDVPGQQGAWSRLPPT